MGRKSKITVELIEKTCYLASQGMAQKMIKTRLGVSQATVSRALKAGVERGWISESPRCLLSEGRQREIEELIYGHVRKHLLEVCGRGAKRLREVRVYDSGPHSMPAVEEEFHLRHALFGRAAARYFGGEIVPGVRAVGITWGATLHNLVDGLRGWHARPPRADEPVWFVPVCGDPPEVHATALRSSSSLVARLDDLVNGRDESPYAFMGIASSIPASFRGKEVGIIQRFFGENEGYRRIFGDGDGERGLICRLDAILTSVGSSEEGRDPWLGEAALSARVPKEVLERLTVGNIGGVLLERAGVTARQRAVVDRVNDRWTGIRLEHFERCAKAAAAPRARNVGVVVAALGPKAGIVRECVRRGLINRLIIDQELAAQLTE